MSLISRLAVIGAGSVGTSLAYAALIRRSASEVILYDIDAAKTEAEVLDLAHGTQFTGTSKVSGGGDISCVAGASVVVITAGAKQKPGQTRLELAGTNVAILESLMPRLLEHAPDAVYILVSNPVDVLTVAAAQIAGLPDGRLFGSGCVLDSARLRWLIAERSRGLPAERPRDDAGRARRHRVPAVVAGQDRHRAAAGVDRHRRRTGCSPATSAPPSTTTWCTRRTRSSPARVRPTTRSG